mgnify:CR=1 FL=1
MKEIKFRMIIVKARVVKVLTDYYSGSNGVIVINRFHRSIKGNHKNTNHYYGLDAGPGQCVGQYVDEYQRALGGNHRAVLRRVGK